MSTTIVNTKNILNTDVEITGTLQFKGELTFDRKLNGDIASEGILNLGDNAIIKGNLNVNSVVLRGRIQCAAQSFLWL
jgi:cytoskeletal protein CcmA (bactofilin family)